MPYKDPEKQREADRRWRAANLEKVREANRRWREANPEKARGANRRWREANPEKGRGQSRRWREANLEKARAREAAYRAANREVRRAHMAAYRASQKDATRLHAREATFVQTPEGPGAPPHRAHGERTPEDGDDDNCSPRPTARTPRRTAKPKQLRLCAAALVAAVG